MKWNEVLKGSQDPVFFLPSSGVKKHALIKVPTGRKIDMGKLRTLIGVPVVQVTDMKTLPERMRDQQILIVQIDDIGMSQEVLSVGRTLDSGMVLVNTTMGEMFYNSFAILWVIYSQGTPSEELKKSCVEVEISEEEDIWEEKQ